MARFFDQLNDRLTRFIQEQQLFFVATAGVDGRVNLSPKGLDSLRILSPNKIIWLNLTGSGNETAAHLLEVNRMTIMFCSFDKNPLILRLYGTAQTYHATDPQWAEYVDLFPDKGAKRQIYEVTIQQVQTSCGYAVPFYEFKGERDTLYKWSETKSEEDLRNYWEEKNVLSIDGKPTGIPL